MEVSIEMNQTLIMQQQPSQCVNAADSVATVPETNTCECYHMGQCYQLKLMSFCIITR